MPKAAPFRQPYSPRFTRALREFHAERARHAAVDEFLRLLEPRLAPFRAAMNAASTRAAPWRQAGSRGLRSAIRRCASPRAASRGARVPNFDHYAGDLGLRIIWRSASIMFRCRSRVSCAYALQLTARRPPGAGPLARAKLRMEAYVICSHTSDSVCSRERNVRARPRCFSPPPGSAMATASGPP